MDSIFHQRVSANESTCLQVDHALLSAFIKTVHYLNRRFWRANGHSDHARGKTTWFLLSKIIKDTIKLYNEKKGTPKNHRNNQRVPKYPLGTKNIGVYRL